jgi:hypothetical protein
VGLQKFRGRSRFRGFDFANSHIHPFDPVPAYTYNNNDLKQWTVRNT